MLPRGIAGKLASSNHRHPALEGAAVNETNPLGLESVAQGFGIVRQDRATRFKLRNRSSADAGRVCEIIQRPAERGPRHAALSDVHGLVVLAVKEVCRPLLPHLLIAFGKLVEQQLHRL